MIGIICKDRFTKDAPSPSATSRRRLLQSRPAGPRRRQECDSIAPPLVLTKPVVHWVAISRRCAFDLLDIAPLRARSRPPTAFVASSRNTVNRTSFARLPPFLRRTIPILPPRRIAVQSLSLDAFRWQLSPRSSIGHAGNPVGSALRRRARDEVSLVADSPSRRGVLRQSARRLGEAAVGLSVLCR